MNKIENLTISTRIYIFFSLRVKNYFFYIDIKSKYYLKIRRCRSSYGVNLRNGGWRKWRKCRNSFIFCWISELFRAEVIVITMTLVLTKAELERMKRSVQDIPADFSAQERRAELKKKSEERVKHWPNTLEALRKKKENFIKEKAEQEELKRQEIDKQVRTFRLH